MISASPAYTAARETTAIVPLRDWGWLRVAGPDRLAFLQRLSTNDFRGPAPGRGLPTVLTSPTGRVIALVIAYASADSLYLRTEPGRGGPVRRYLSKLIFWNDHVEIGEGGEVSQWGLYGPAATETLQRGVPSLPADLPPYAWAKLNLPEAGGDVSLHRGGPLELTAWTLVSASNSAPSVSAVTAVAPSGADLLGRWMATLGPQLDPAALEQLRVEAGIPGWGRELSDQVTPLEAGLLGAVHFNKGCYTGQEVIARMTNYDKIGRRLAGLLLPEGAGPELNGAPVRAGGGRPGFVGTVVDSPALGRPIALAVVPREAAVPGTEVSAGSEATAVRAVVAALPFVEFGRPSPGKAAERQPHERT